MKPRHEVRHHLIGAAVIASAMVVGWCRNRSGGARRGLDDVDHTHSRGRAGCDNVGDGHHADDLHDPTGGHRKYLPAGAVRCQASAGHDRRRGSGPHDRARRVPGRSLCLRLVRLHLERGHHRSAHRHGGQDPDKHGPDHESGIRPSGEYAYAPNTDVGSVWQISTKTLSVVR